MKITVLENAVPKLYADYLEKVIMYGEVPYACVKNTASSQKYITKLTKDSPQFIHLTLDCGKILSEFFNIINPVQFFAAELDKTINPNKLFRCKINLNIKDTSYTNDEHYVTHVDIIDDLVGITGIYYVNDSDGDTLFFDETGNTVIKRFTPKKGSFVFFDNKIPHAGQPPKNTSIRAVINFNWALN